MTAGLFSHPQDVDRVLDLVAQQLDDEWRATETAMLLDDVDPEEIDSLRSWRDWCLSSWRPCARAWLLGVLVRERVH